MFLVVKPQCNSMEMNYLSTVWLQMSVGGQLFKRFGEEVFFLIFLPNIHFGVLSQSFNISNLFTLSCQPWLAVIMVHTARMSYQRIAVRLSLASFNHTEMYGALQLSLGIVHLLFMNTLTSRTLV